MTEEAKSKAPGFTLRQFVKAGGERLKLSVVVDAGLDHPVTEPMMYRPGLALTGFFGNFAKHFLARRPKLFFRSSTVNFGYFFIRFHTRSTTFHI